MPCIEAKLASVSRDSITVELNTGEKFILPFDRYGYFRFCSIAELEHVTCDGFALEWPEAMIDLELDLLRHPEKEGTPTPVDKWLAFRENLRKKAAIRENALRAARTKSARKAASSRINGKKGGRPKKEQNPMPV
ncbi:MAG: DUF2442 domain-containing protein [Lentisphaerae bacterium]|jgi:hypothetical protein|nr:DUF2442 domain-containing protein [Lentisphaerota bacterium]